MTCEHFAELLSDYCEHRLATREMAFAREHTELCSQCRDDAEIWQKLAGLPRQELSRNSRARVETMLNAYQEGRWEKSSLVQERGTARTARYAPARKPFRVLR